MLLASARPFACLDRWAQRLPVSATQQVPARARPPGKAPTDSHVPLPFVPVQAARWRKQQRKRVSPLLGAAMARQAAAAAGGEDGEDAAGQPKGGLFRALFAQQEPPSIQSRTAGILDADRGESSLDDDDL